MEGGLPSESPRVVGGGSDTRRLRSPRRRLDREATNLSICRAIILRPWRPSHGTWSSTRLSRRQRTSLARLRQAAWSFCSSPPSTSSRRARRSGGSTLTSTKTSARSFRGTRSSSGTERSRSGGHSTISKVIFAQSSSMAGDGPRRICPMPSVPSKRSSDSAWRCSAEPFQDRPCHRRPQGTAPPRADRQIGDPLRVMRARHRAAG